MVSGSDFAGNETKRSTSGVVILMNCGPLAWSSTMGRRFLLLHVKLKFMLQWLR